MLFNAPSAEQKEKRKSQPREILVLDFSSGEAVSTTFSAPGGQNIPLDDLENPNLLQFYGEDYSNSYKECKYSETSARHYTSPVMFSAACSDIRKDPLLQFYARCIKDVNYFIKCLGVTPHWQQQELIDAYAAGNSNIAVRSGQGPGKCPTYHNIIISRRHGRVQVGEMDGRVFEILSMSDSGKLIWKKATCNKNELKNCHKITTNSGNEVELSSDHPVFTQRGWIEAKEITTDDLIAVPREVSILTDENTLSDDVAYLFGAMIGDGGTSTRSPVFTQENNSTLERVSRIVDSLGGKITYRSRYDYGISNLTNFFEFHGLIGKKSIDKQVPLEIYRNGERGIINFLTGLWECDGYATKDGYGICLASKRLIYDVQYLLEILGISSNVRYKKSKCKDKEFDSWRLEVSGVHDLKVWLKKIGQIARKNIPDSLISRTENSNKDIVPIKIEQWEEIASEIGTNISSFRSKNFRARKDSYLTRKKFEEFCSEFNYTGKYAWMACSDIRWVRVTKVENTGMQQTYDVSVEDTHNFVCNNIVIHNTWTAAVIWLHWLLANRYGLLVVTAPTMRQCKEVWLAQARKLISSETTDIRLKAAYEFTGTGIQMFGCKAADWGCYLATANKAENFQGIHRHRLGIHCEEASGLDAQIIQTIKGTLSNAEGTYLWLQIGNPNTRSCAFFDCFYGKNSVWKALHWNGEETPETEYFSQRRNTEIEEEFGKDSDIYRVRVLGEFPALDSTAILTLEDLMECTKPAALIAATRENKKSIDTNTLKRHIGIDLARFGGDESTIVPWDGNIQKKLEAFSHVDPNDVVDKAVVMQEVFDWDDKESLYIVDTSGMGEAAVGRIGQKKRLGKRVHEFYSQNCANDSTKYANKISEAWFLFAKAVKKKEVYLVYDKRTFDQIINRRYCISNSGQLKVESKDEYRKRLTKNGDDMGEIGKSPDRADGLIMGYYPVAEESTRIRVFEE